MLATLVRERIADNQAQIWRHLSRLRRTGLPSSFLLILSEHQHDFSPGRQAPWFMGLMGELTTEDLTIPLLPCEYGRHLRPSIELNCGVFEDDLVRQRLGDGQARVAHYAGPSEE
jgi:hypothetical protein